jgi:hypothetical protein
MAFSYTYTIGPPTIYTIVICSFRYLFSIFYSMCPHIGQNAQWVANWDITKTRSYTLITASTNNCGRLRISCVDGNYEVDESRYAHLQTCAPPDICAHIAMGTLEGEAKRARCPYVHQLWWLFVCKYPCILGKSSFFSPQNILYVTS